MKKLFLSLILLVGVFTLTRAQGVDFGLKVGLNMATLNGDVEDMDMKSALHAGAFLNLKLNKKFAISPEILFSQQGAKTDEGRLSLDYVNIPVLVKINPVKVLNIHFGPQLGFLLSAKEDNDDVKELFNSSDLSFAGGLGLDLPLGVIAGARYNVSLGNIMNDEGFKLTHQYFQFYVGYRLF
jgi:hypothetical protein